MGRAKIAMKYIQNEKSRKIAFNQRKKGLTTKISQFTNKSGAKACLIVYDDDDGNVGSMTWPEDLTIVNSMLQEYENQKIERTLEIFDVNDYFENKKDDVEAKITRVRKVILKNKYPTWHPDFNNMEENQLRDFIGTIDAKIQACNNKINMLNSETSFLQNNAHMQDGVVSSHSNEVNVIHSIPEMQQHTKGISEVVDMISHVDSPLSSSTKKLSEHVEWSDQTANHDYISEMVDLTSLGDLPSNSSTKKLREHVEWSNQTANHDYISEMVDLTSLGDFPSNSSTKKLSEHVEWSDQAANHDYISEMVDLTSLGDFPSNSSTKKLNEHVEWSDKAANQDYISEMVDITSLGDLPSSSSTKKLNEHVEWSDQVANQDYISEMVDFTSLGDLPSSSSTKKLSELVEWIDQPANHDYISEIVDFTSLGDFPSSLSTNQPSQLVDLDWKNQLYDGGLHWGGQPGQFDWKDLSCLSQNEEGSASLDGLAQKKDRV